MIAVSKTDSTVSLLSIAQHQGDECTELMNASTSEMLVKFFQTALRNNPEDSHLQGNVFEKDRKSAEVHAQCISPCSSPCAKNLQVIWYHQ
jgi:hypothetical protein